MSPECTCPSGQSGHAHAGWCAKESRQTKGVTRELIETLSDARAYFEKEYLWEQEHIIHGGGSKIAMGQARRYADAIAIAAIMLGKQVEDAESQ